MPRYQPDWSHDDLDRDGDPVLRKAIFWHEMMTGTPPSETTAEEFSRWLAASEANANAYAQISALWLGMAALPGRGNDAKAGRRLSRRNVLLGGLATIGAGATAGLWLSGHPFADLKTARGQAHHQTLADGSRVELAGLTALSFDITPRMRRLEIHRGALWLDLARTEIPAEITLARTRILGNGARLAFEAGSAGGLLTVLDHQVTMRDRTGDLVVAAGQQATFAGNGITLAEADLESTLAWREGRLVYVSQPLARIVEGLNRWGKNQIFILGSALAQRPATLILDIAQIDEALDQLAEALPMRILHAPGGVVFIS